MPITYSSLPHPRPTNRHSSFIPFRFVFAEAYLYMCECVPTQKMRWTGSLAERFDILLAANGAKCRIQSFLRPAHTFDGGCGYPSCLVRTSCIVLHIYFSRDPSSPNILASVCVCVCGVRGQACSVSTFPICAFVERLSVFIRLPCLSCIIFPRICMVYGRIWVSFICCRAESMLVQCVCAVVFFFLFLPHIRRPKARAQSRSFLRFLSALYSGITDIV